MCKPQMVVQPLGEFLCMVAEPALAWHLFSVITVVSLFDKACLAAISAALGQPLFFQAPVRVSSNNDTASTLLSLIAILFQFISFQRLFQAFKKGRQGSLVSCLWLAGCHAGRNIAGCSRRGLTWRHFSWQLILHITVPVTTERQRQGGIQKKKNNKPHKTSASIYYSGIKTFRVMNEILKL